MAEVAKRGMAVHDLDLLSDENLSQVRKGRKHCRERGRPIDHPVRQMVDFETVCQVPDTLATRVRGVVGVSDHDHAVPTVDEFLS